MKALIHKGLVVQVEEVEFEVHEDLSWVEAQEGVAPGWTYANGQFTAPVIPEFVPVPTPTKEELLAQLAMIQQQIQALS